MECILCHQAHSVPENGWPIDDTMKNVTSHLKTIFGNMLEDENYKQLKEKINIYENKLEVYKMRAENPEQIIEEYFSNLISQVDLRSEILKLEIDKISKYFRTKINKERERYIIQSKNKEENKIDFVKEKEKIEKSKNYLNSFKVTEFQYWIKELNDSIIKLENAQSLLERNILNDTEIRFIQSNEKFEENKFGNLEIERTINTENENFEISDSEEGREKRTLIVHSREISSLVLLPNGELASGSHNNSIKIWIVNEGREIRTITVQSNSNLLKIQ
jgi:WD40 repeat protein